MSNIYCIHKNALIKPIPTLDCYYACNNGCVVSIKRKSPIVLKPSLNNSGYLMVKPSVNGVHQTHTVHKLIMWAFKGIHDNTKTDIDHKDSVKTNNCLSNLRYATRKENMEYAYKNGLTRIGSENNLAKLNEDAVKSILISNLSQKEIATKYSVTIATVSRIRSRKIWRHVT